MDANLKQQSKTDKWKTQEVRTFAAFRRPRTRLQASIEASVPLQNVCRYVGKLKRLNKIFVTKVDIDPISGCRAEFLSVDPRYRNGHQMAMFQ